VGAGDRNQEPLAELERLYRSRQARFRRVAFALLRNQEDAREAVQEAFARAVRARGSFRGEGELEAWVWRTLTNICLDAKRQDARRNGTGPVDLEPPSEGSGPLDEDVRTALGLLPERQRLVLFLRHYADLPYDGIGEVLGIERGTVAATLHAAHASLRQTMKEGAR
jgi:RNA polymerase sigma-70 factor (ECF subfamily)